MNKEGYINEAEENILHTYNRFSLVLDHGEGVYLYDTDGKEYLDFAAGFAVWKRRAYEILPMMLLLGCWGTLLLGPVVSLRYALPLIYCVPRLLEMIVGLTGKR